MKLEQINISDIKLGDIYQHLPSGEMHVYLTETDLAWGCVNADNYTAWRMPYSEEKSTITLTIKRSNAIEEWKMKEEGSYEDSKRSQNHVFAILKRFRGKVILTEEQADTVIKSGQYHSTAWNDDEIVGGARTKKAIAGICAKIQTALNK